MTKPRLYCVIYRTGGTENFEWHRSIPFTNYADAFQCMLDTHKAGYPCHVENYWDSMSIGLPETFSIFDRIER